MSLLDKFSKKVELKIRKPLSSVFGEKNLEDGKTSLRGIRQYKSWEEIYKSFGEILPEGKEARRDFHNRATRFQIERDKNV